MMQSIQSPIEQIQEESVNEQSYASAEYIHFDNCELKLSKHILEGFTTQQMLEWAELKDQIEEKLKTKDNLQTAMEMMNTSEFYSKLNNKKKQLVIENFQQLNQKYL